MIRLLLFAVVLFVSQVLTTGAQAPSFKFDFRHGEPAAGWTGVTGDLVYGDGRGFGFEPGQLPRAPGPTGVSSGPDCTSSTSPFSFSVKVPEGNWLVTATLGRQNAISMTTVKAETRRLMVGRTVTAPGQRVRATFVVNIRNARMTPPLPQNAPGGSAVRLTNLDPNTLNWDDKLTLEFLDENPSVCAVEIVRADQLPTVFLAGDSTVTDQVREPSASWGQMVTAFLKPTVAVANYAASGQTMKSFVSDLRFDKMLSQMKAGDYVIVQFGHNDEKRNWPQTYVEPFRTHDAWMNVFIEEARLRGVTTVLVSPMERRTGINGNTHGDFPASVAATAKARKVAFIDLWARSKTLYAAMGSDVGEAFADATHHRNYGAYQLAKLVVQGIKDADLPLAAHIVEGFGTFDPARPDPLSTFFVAPSGIAR